MDWEFAGELFMCFILGVLILVVLFGGIFGLTRLGLFEAVDTKCQCNCCGCQVNDAQDLD